MNSVSYLAQALSTAAVLMLSLYGAWFDPPASRIGRWTAGLISGLASLWLIILLIVAGSLK